MSDNKKQFSDLLKRFADEGLITFNKDISSLEEMIEDPNTSGESDGVYDDDLVISIDIEHEQFMNIFLKDEHIFDELFNCNTVYGLQKNINKISTKYKKIGYNDDNGSSGKNKFAGDLFEIFGEIFFKLTSTDSRVGVTEYHPIKDKDDFGVDGIGKAMNGKRCAIQIKFRTNVGTELIAEDLGNFQGQAYRKYNVPVGTTENLIILTNCKGLHWNTATNVLDGTVICFDYNNPKSTHSLNDLLNQNDSFWKSANSVIRYNIDNIMNTYGIR